MPPQHHLQLLLLTGFLPHAQPFPTIFAVFSAFIPACGTTHLMDVWTNWRADSWLAGRTKAPSAMLSVVTAIMVVSVVPIGLAWL